MAKYTYRVVQDEASWTAEIVRRASATKNVVSKKQSGFSTELEAQEWAKKELEAFTLNQQERNKRKDKKRE